MKRRRWSLVLLVACLAACGESSTRAEPPATNAPATGAPSTAPPGQLYEGEFTVLADDTHGAELCTGVEESLPPQCSGLPVTNWDWGAVQGEERLHGTAWGGWHVRGTYADGRFTLVGAPTEPAPDSDEPDDDTDFSPACAEPDVEDASAGVAAWEEMSQTPEWNADQHDVVAAWVTNPGRDWDGSFVGNVVVRPGAKDETQARIRESYAGALCVVERDGPTVEELSAVQEQLTDADARAVLGLVTAAGSDNRRGVVVGNVWVVTPEVLDYAHDRWGDLVELRGNLTPVD